MKRGQAQVFWVLLEFVLVIAASYGMDRLIDRARDNTLPEQNYAAIETAFTRQSLDLYAQTTAYYEQYIPGIPIDRFKLAFKEGELSMNSSEVTYGYDTLVKDGGGDTKKMVIIPLGIANGMVNVTLQERIRINKLAVPCSPIQIPRKIAVLPADKDASELAIQLLRENVTRFTPQTAQIAGLLDTTNEQVQAQRKQFIDSADAVIVVARSPTAKQSLVYHNMLGTGLACTILNGIIPLQDAHNPAEFNAASLPVIKQNLPTSHAAQELPDNKPAILLIIGTDQNAIEVARGVHATLK